jgi:hypothetical protein
MLSFGGRISRSWLTFGAAAALGACGESQELGAGGAAFDGSPAEMAKLLAEGFSEQGQSIPSYTLAEWHSLPTGDLPPEVAGAAVLSLRGAIAMDPYAFDNVFATFLIFESPADATGFFDSFRAGAESSAGIAAQEIELTGNGVPTSLMHCIADRSTTEGMTCAVLEDELGIVDLILYANGPAIESAYGTPTYSIAGLEFTSDEEKWYIKGFEDESFYRSVTLVGSRLHRYVNETVGD